MIAGDARHAPYILAPVDGNGGFVGQGAQKLYPMRRPFEISVAGTPQPTA